jgi:hypothetical protein
MLHHANGDSQINFVILKATQILRILPKIREPRMLVMDFITGDNINAIAIFLHIILKLTTIGPASDI